MKNPLTLAGIEQATFRFVTQHLNHCATAVSIPTSRESMFMGIVQTVDNVGTHVDSVASSALSMTSSKLCDTSSQYQKFSTLLNYAVAVMVQHQTSNTVRQS